MWITIPDKEENNTFDKIKRGELFISTKHNCGDEEVFMRTENIEICDEEFNAVNLHTGDLYYFECEDNVESIRATLNIKRG